MQDKKKILVIRYRFIGDTILTLPFLKNLRLANPDAQIDMLVAPKSGEIIENCPYVDNFIYFDTNKKHKYENGSEPKKNFWYYVKLLRKNKYDKAYVLKRSISSALLVFFSGIKERIGFNTEGRGFLLTKKVPATNKGKLWPIENFAEITRFLINEKNVQVFFVGTDFDSETYEKMLDIIKENLIRQPINLCGKLNLQECLAFTAQMDLLIGNDSGNLHIASSVKTPVIGLYGPMPFEKWYALGDNNVLLKSNLPCVPCGLSGKCSKNYECMKKIYVDDVKKAINKYFP